MGAEDGCSDLVGLWRRVVASGGRVALVMGDPVARPREPVLPGDVSFDKLWGSISGLIEWSVSTRGERWVELLGGAASRGLVERLVYLGLGCGVAERLGERVLMLYGCYSRARCPRCGRRVYLRSAPAGALRCPRCGVAMAPDFVPQGGLVSRRLLSEAVYEVSVADLLVACCLGGESLGVLLVGGAAKLSGAPVALLGDDPVLGHVSSLRCRRGLEWVLEQLLSHG